VYFGTSPTPPLAGNTTSTSYQLSGLSNSTKYYWQVVAKNTCGNSTAGSIWSFTTAAAPAPVISGVSSSSITGSGASISWQTDLASDSQVEYGATTSYGSSATLDASLVTSHSQALTALASGTAYHYRVKSRSAAGALATSGDYTFATPDASPPVISAISASSLTGTSAAISWTTNETSDSQVEYGTTTSYGRLTTLDSAKVISHSQSLSGLSGSTTYHYRVKSQDAAGNLATSGDYTFTTLDVTAPTISSVAASGIAATSATIAWTTNEASDSQVEYGTTTSYGGSTTLNASMVTSHSQALAGLASGTTYHYRIKSRDAFGNLATSGDFTFTTLDVTAPTISAVSATGITATGATITWTTNEASDSQVEYGVSALYGNSVALDTARTTAHSQSLGGLSSATTYHYRVKSRDAAGNLAVSGDYAFTTLEDAGTPPVISGLAISKVTSRGATVTWTTDVPADTQVFYGTTAACSSSTKIKTALTTSHTQSLSGLKANTTYYFRVQSADARRNLAVSEIFTFSTTTGKEIRLVYPLVQGQQAGSATSGDGSQPDSSEFVGIAIANLSGADAVLRFTTHDRAGAEITGPDIVNPAERILAPGEQLALVDLQIFGRGLPNRQNLGWIDIDSNVQELGTFALIFNASLSMMEGMIAPDASLTQFVFSEIEDRGFTNLHVANPSEDPANITFQLLGAGGELRTSAQRTINPLGSIAESVTTLFPDISLDASDSIRVHSDTGVIPFELFGQKTHDVAALNGHDTYAGATKLYAPQYVVGGSYRSTLSVTNLEATDGRLTIQMFDDNGRQIGASRSIPIAAFGKVYISDPDFFNYYGQEMVEGYVQIKSNGPTLAGSVTFTDAFRESFATALPLVRSLEESMVFSHVATDSTYFMGLSLLNPEPTAAEATIELHRADGSIEATTSVTISPRHRLCSLVTEIFPELEGQSRTSGFIRVKSNGGVAAYSVFGTRDLRSLSAVPAQIVR
jgi:hypothetical protein